MPDSIRHPVSFNASHGMTSEACNDEMVQLPGGTFAMGDAFGEGYPADFEGPVRDVTLAPFRIAPTAVTNAQFNEFVRATGYVTQAEQAGSSFVFYLQLPPHLRSEVRSYPSGLPWWAEVADACWQRPHGPGSSARERPDHPVVHVSWHDAQSYCTWAGCRLPLEAEWEFAARGGLEGKRYVWGNDMPSEPPCNIWRGEFPNRPAEGWRPDTVPVRFFAPNGYGLHEMAGNTWEWCEDEFLPGDERRAMRGGSFLCHDSYCNRYRVAARGSNTPGSTASNVGFRVAM